MGNWFTNLFDRQNSMVTDPYSQALAAETQGYWKSLKNEQGGFNQNLYNTGSPFDTAMRQAMSGNQFGSPEDIQGMNENQIQDYYKKTMHDPAVMQYQNITRPSWMENVGNLHSSYRDNMEQQGYENLYGGLEQQRGNLQYQNLLNNQNLTKYNQGMDQQTNMMNMQAQQGAMGLNQIYDPQQMYMNMLRGQTPTSTVTQGASPMDMASQMASLAATTGSAASLLYG